MKRLILWLVIMSSFRSYTKAQDPKLVKRIEHYLKVADEADSKLLFKEAAQFYKNAIDLSNSARLPNYLILACLDGAKSKINAGSTAEAILLVQRAFGCYKVSGDRSVRRQFMIYHGFASAYQSNFQHDSSTYYFNQCAQLLATKQDSLNSFNSYLYNYYLDLSYQAQETMNYHESVTMNLEAIRRYRLRYKKEPVGNYNSLAKAYLALGDFAKADAAFEQAIRQYTDEPLYIAIIQCNLTESKLQQKAIKAARKSLQQAQKAYQRYFRQTPPPAIDLDVERRLKQNEANVLLAEGKLAPAKNAFADLLAFSSLHFTRPAAFRVEAYLSLGNLHQQEGNTKAALQAFNDAIQEAYGPQARSWQQAILPRSLSTALIQKATFLSTIPSDTQTNRLAYAKEALNSYEQAIDLIALLRRGALLTESKAFLAQKSASLYGPALSLCYELAQQPGMASVFQQRAFVLFDKQQNSLLADSQLEQQLVRQYLPKPLQTEFRLLNQRLSRLRLVREGSTGATVNAEINKTETSLIAWQQRVSNKFPEYTKAFHRISQLSLLEYRKHLAAGEMVLCYAPTPSGLLVLALNREACTLRRIPVSQQTLKQAVANYRAEVTRDPGIVGFYDHTPARRLSSIVLAPVQDQLRSATALTVIMPPDWQIPFEALENRTGRTLIYDIDVGYQFNLSGRLLPEKSHPAKHESLTMAPFGADTGRGPFQMKTGHLLPPLRASVREASLLGGLHWIGRKASKQRFLADAPEAKVLLLTTHTYPGERETALVFYPSGHSESDYLLYPSEFQHLDLRTVDFAALSACATEKGVQLPGDGVHSLGRAAAWAGVRSVTCSWFPINDEAQALMGRYFYPKLTNGKSMRENLRQARLEFLSSAEGLRYSGHPFYWASTALYGGHNAVTTNSFWPNSWLFSLLICFLGLVGWVVFRKKPLSKTVGF